MGSTYPDLEPLHRPHRAKWLAFRHTIATPAGYLIASGRRSIVFLAFVAVVSGASAVPGWAQTVHVISGAPVCRTCRIELQRTATVVDSTSPWLSDFITVTQDSRGYLYGASALRSPGVIYVHDATGRLIHRYGRAGNGPGEGRFTGAPVIGAGDTAFVSDAMLGRISVWSPTFEFVRSFNAPGRITEMRALSANELVIVAQIPTRDLSGWPMHIISTKDGSVLRSFGAETPAFRYDAYNLSRRYIDVAGGNRIWVAQIHAYVLGLYDSDGRKLMGSHPETA